MKPNKVNSITKALTFVSVFACAALALLAMAYIQTTHKLVAAQEEAELTSTLVEATRYHVLLKEINSGEIAKAKAFMKSSMEYDLLAMKPMIEKCENPRTQSFAVTYASRLGHTESKGMLVANQHTGYLATSVTPIGAH